MNGAAAGREELLYAGVARLTRSLHEALRELGLDSRLVRLAGSDIPDACERLDHVVRLGEEAAHRTLDLVEQEREIADGFGQAAARIGALRERLEPGAAAAAAQELGAIGAAVAGGEARLRAALTALAQAQEYQDLSGQVVGRVIRLVRNVETGLHELLRASGLQAGAPLPISAEDAAAGAAAAGAGPAADQADADRLLASLGF